jgi:histidine ammonia-lyase
MADEPLDLSDPAVRARYITELRMVASGARRAGIMLAVLGVIAAVLRATVWPWMPELVPLVLIVTALGLMLLGIVRRIRYHLKRRRG